MASLLPRAAALAGSAAVFLTAAVATAVPAAATDGSIDHVEPTADGLQVLVSVPADAEVDLDEVTVTVDGVDAPAEAVPADTQTLVQRTAVLVIDTSNSMRGARFRAARAAAETFLAALPDDVRVGMVGFADEVTPLLQPTTDRDAARAVLADLTLSRQTRLYDGVLAGVEMAGADGHRTLLVLSDGADTSDTAPGDAAEAITASGVLVHVVALEQETDLESLGRLADAGEGEVVNADRDALSAAFAAEAEVLARQVAVTAQVPAEVDADRASIEVSLASSDGEIRASAFAPVHGTIHPASSGGDSGWVPPAWLMLVGVGGVGAGLVVLLTLLVPSRPRPMSAADRVAAYTTRSDSAAAKPDADDALSHAREAVAGVLRRNRSLDEKISLRLEGAGSALKSSEWIMLRAAVLLAAGTLGLLLGQGDLVVGLLFLAIGAFGPGVYLGLRRWRRRKAFAAALPDTLQLMSGSLAAGLSLAQSVDTIVREGTEPVAGEFRRVLVESRLGVSLENSLEGVAERLDSKDFGWVVMAIRIQREVGGNLAELLETVAGTMREREYLRRQVNALAAEGKLSAFVLAVLPPGFLLYLLVAQRDYLMPLFTDPRGIFMLVGGSLWLLLGILWMSKLVKVEV